MPYFDSDVRKYCSSWKLSHLLHTMKWACQGADDLSKSVDEWVKITSKLGTLHMASLYMNTMGLIFAFLDYKKTTKGNHDFFSDSLYKTANTVL